METRPLGTDGPPVTRLGLGLAALGRPGYMTLGHADDLAESGTTVEAMRERAHYLLDHAYDAGLRYFDTARSYGEGERFVSEWLAQGPKKGAVIGSKWGYRYTADWKTDAAVHEVKDHSLAAFERQLAETDALLGRNLALYQIHSATLSTGVLDDVALHRRLAKLRERGVRVGLTVTGPEQHEVILRALDVTVDGVPLFQTVQATWNLLERSATNALIEADERGVGVIVKEPLANGRLTLRGGQKRYAGTAPDAVALAAALANPWAHVVLLGAATSGQLESNLVAVAVPADLVAQMSTDVKALDPQRYWSERAALRWT